MDNQPATQNGKTHSKRKLKSTRVFTISAFATLTLIVVLALTNLYLLRSTSKQLASIDDVNHRKLDIVLRMTHIVRERSMVMLTMFIDDDMWRTDENYMKYNKLALNFIQLRDQLNEVGLTKEENNELEKALTFIRQTEPMQNEIVERIRSGGDKTLRKDISQHDLPLEYKLLAVFDKLSNQIRENTYHARHEARHSYQRSLFIVAILSLFIAIGIFILLYRSLHKIQKIERSLLDETQNLNWEATHDPLTNIYNRRWLEHRIFDLNSQQDAHTIHSLIYIDLDNFKQINEDYLHSGGDAYLIGFCREVEKHIRQNDMFVRLGGDEFAILLENCDRDHAKEIAENIIAKINTLIVHHKKKTISTQCSIGLLSFRSGTNNLDDILGKADSLCFEAKRQGKNGIYCAMHTI